MVKFWNTPLLTVGAMTHDFTNGKTSCEDEYHMMTRMGSISFRDLSSFFGEIMDEYVHHADHTSQFDSRGKR